MAPKLEYGNFPFTSWALDRAAHRDAFPLSAFSETLEREGWEVHTQLDDPTGPPLEDFSDGYEKEAELNRSLQELDNGLTKRALVLKTSHIGGHKYAGNIIVGLSPLVRAEPVQC